MVARKLFPACLILGAFALGTVAATVWHVLSDTPQDNLAIALGLLGLCFGLFGLSVGLTRSEDRKYLDERWHLNPSDRGRSARAEPSSYSTSSFCGGMEQGVRGLGKRDRSVEYTSPSDAGQRDSADVSRIGQAASESRDRSEATRRACQQRPSTRGTSTSYGNDPVESQASGRETVAGSDLCLWEPDQLGADDAERLQDKRLSTPEIFQAPPFRTDELIQVWEEYEANGDGHFTPAGLGQRLENAGLEARAIAGEELGSGDAVLGVEPLHGGSQVYLLPDFNRPASAVADWFENQGSGVRTAYIKRLIQVAEVERRGSELVIRRKGVVA